MSVVYIIMAGHEYDGYSPVCAFSDKAVADEYCKRMEAHQSLCPEWDQGVDESGHESDYKKWQNASDFPEHASDWNNMFYVQAVEARL